MITCPTKRWRSSQPDYHFEEIIDRLKNEPVRFKILVQLAAEARRNR